MKATQTQYEQAYRIYEKHGQYAVYKFAQDNNIDEWSWCVPCEDNTPDCDDNVCLVCGSVKEEIK